MRKPRSQQRGHVTLQVASLCFRATAPLSRVRRPGFASQCTRRCCAPCRGRRGACQCFATWQSERCGAGCMPRFASHRGWALDRRWWRYPQLRPHASLLHKAALREVPASQSRSSFGVVHRFAPCGFTQQALCKVAYAGAGLSVVGASRSVPALRAANCRPGVVLVLWHQSVAPQVPLVSGFAVHLVFAPPTLGPRHASRALALRGLPVRPQGAPSEPRGVKGARFMHALRACQVQMWVVRAAFLIDGGALRAN